MVSTSLYIASMLTIIAAALNVRKWVDLDEPLFFIEDREHLVSNMKVVLHDHISLNFRIKNVKY